MEALFTVEDWSRLLNKSPQAIYLMRHEGKLPPAIKIGRNVYWEPSAVQGWIDANREVAAS